MSKTTGWLCLTRRRGQRVRLTVAGVTVWVRVDRVAAGEARLAFLAPPEVEIVRSELLEDGPRQDGGPIKAPGEGRAQDAP